MYDILNSVLEDYCYNVVITENGLELEDLQDESEPKRIVELLDVIDCFIWNINELMENSDVDYNKELKALKNLRIELV